MAVTVGTVHTHKQVNLTNELKYVKIGFKPIKKLYKKKKVYLLMIALLTNIEFVTNLIRDG